MRHAWEYFMHHERKGKDSILQAKNKMDQANMEEIVKQNIPYVVITDMLPRTYTVILKKAISIEEFKKRMDSAFGDL